MQINGVEQFHCYWNEISLVIKKLPAFCICKNKGADHLRGNREADQLTAKLISAFVFATRIVQSLYFLNPKFQASIYLLWRYSPVCVRPDRKPRRPVFSQSENQTLATSCLFIVVYYSYDSALLVKDIYLIWLA